MVFNRMVKQKTALVLAKGVFKCVSWIEMRVAESTEVLRRAEFLGAR